MAVLKKAPPRPAGPRPAARRAHGAQGGQGRKGGPGRRQPGAGLSVGNNFPAAGRRARCRRQGFGCCRARCRRRAPCRTGHTAARGARQACPWVYEPKRGGSSPRTRCLWPTGRRCDKPRTDAAARPPASRRLAAGRGNPRPTRRAPGGAAVHGGGPCRWAGARHSGGVVIKTDYPKGLRSLQ